MQLRFLVLAAVAVAAAISLCAPGCSNQGEGERCDRNDDNLGADDCTAGLACDLLSVLGQPQGTNLTEGRCCPGDRTKATTSICALQVSPAGGDASTVEGGGTPSDAGNDATSDAPVESSATDAPADSPKDAPADSPADALTDAPADAPSSG